MTNDNVGIKPKRKTSARKITGKKSVNAVSASKAIELLTYEYSFTSEQ